MNQDEKIEAKSPFNQRQIAQVLTVQQMLDTRYFPALCPAYVASNGEGDTRHPKEAHLNILQVSLVGLMCPHCGGVYRHIEMHLKSEDLPRKRYTLAGSTPATNGEDLQAITKSVWGSGGGSAPPAPEDPENGDSTGENGQDGETPPQGTRGTSTTSTEGSEGNTGQQGSSISVEIGSGGAQLELSDEDIDVMGGEEDAVARILGGLALRPELLEFALGTDAALSVILKELVVSSGKGHDTLQWVDAGKVPTELINSLISTEINALITVMNAYSENEPHDIPVTVVPVLLRVSALVFMIGSRVSFLLEGEGGMGQAGCIIQAISALTEARKDPADLYPYGIPSIACIEEG